MKKIIHREQIGEIELVKNSRSKNIRLTVKADGGIRVSLPTNVAYSKAESFVDDKMNWIIQNQKKQEQNHAKKKNFSLNTEFSTRYHKLKIKPAKTEKLHGHVDKGVVTISYPDHLDVNDKRVQDHIHYVLDEVVRFEAKQYLPGVIQKWSEKLKLPFRKLTIKNNKSNWGSCSGVNNINLNLHLMRLPEPLIDMIVVHELVHTVIKNHGPEFKAAMLSIFPNIDELETELKKYHPRNFQ